MSQQLSPHTYADSVVAYAQAGWSCILPVPPASKYPPPNGFTGADGRDTDPLTLMQFATERPGDSIALRMPEGIIGIDVDQYVKKGKQKNGATTLAAAVAAWGPLPPTWASTARGDEFGPGESRLMLFRVPPRRYAGTLAAVGPDIEVIQRHHRYAVVWPSVNPETGSLYRWYRPDGSPAAFGEVPRPHDLAELPAAWVAGLAEGASDASPSSSDPASGAVMLQQLMNDGRPECAEITSVRLTALDELTRADVGARHDACSARVYQIVQLGAAGHTGAAFALEELRTAWAFATAGEAREREFHDMLTTAARKAVTLVGEHQVPRDPCVFAEGWEVPAATPADVIDERTGEPVEAVSTPRWFFPREVIGTHAFDPVANLDQPLAQAVLERTYPLLRYAYDSRGWLLRAPDRWELHGDLTNRAVTLVAGLLPLGDPSAEKGSDEEERSKRRARFNTNAGARAIAGRMGALVDGGMHPCAVRLTDLDADPEVLWAGGLPWSLRACSAEAPMESWVARVDPALPHLQTAAVMPELRPTPLWDAFLEAVWPDAEVRAWAMRVLSIALTGYADKALPVMLGERDRGKTQVIVLLMSVLGSYAHAADPRLLGAEGAKAHQSIVFALKGRRLSFIDEGPREGKFAQERLKQLTGGGELTANQMNQNPITFRPTHTLVLTTNDEPVLTDPAIRARVRLIPCEGDPELVRVARQAIGHTNGAAWRAEAPGVLAKMMLEAGAWLRDPVSATTEAAPERIRYLAEHVAVEQDPVRTWLDEETEYYEPGTPSRELYQAFRVSCERSGLRRDSVPTEAAWAKALDRIGVPRFRDKKARRWRLRITPGGGWPTFTPSPAAAGDGFTPAGDGLVTGFGGNPSPVFPQVNPDFRASGDGYDGSEDLFTHVHAPAPAHEARVPTTRQPVTPVTSEPTKAPAAKPRKDPSETAKAKRAAAAEERRLAAVAEASGPSYDLPAMVLRDGSVRTVELAQVAQLLAGVSELTVDVEHSGYPVGHRNYRLRTVQLGTEDYAFVLDPDDVSHCEVMRTALAAAPILHAHSATADLVPLEWAGLLVRGIDEAWTRMHDTVIPAKLADPASTGADPSLKKLAPAVLGDAALSPAADEARKALFKAGKWLTDTEPDTPRERSGWAQVDHRSATMLRYDASDVLDDAALAKRLPWIPPVVLDRERTAQRLTARVADRGLRLEPDTVHQLRTEQQANLADAGERLGAFGVANPGSDQQVAAAVERHGLQLPRTATGKPSVAKGILEPFRELEGDLGDLIRARLDYQRAKNRLGLFLDGWHQAITNGDGRIRPTIYTLSADTGRMSAVRPNIQQVPRTGGFRSCITADPGYLLASVDFAQVELRVAAALSQDANLIRTLLEGGDIHMDIARIVWGELAGKAERYRAKPMVFGRLYGSGAAGMARQNGVSEGVASQVIAAMDALMPGLAAWAAGLSSGVRYRTQLMFETYSGRIVHFDKQAPHKAANYAIQGSARELLIDALMRWAQTRWAGAVLFPVHDELVIHIPEDEAEAATAELAGCMATELHGIPILAEPSEPTYAWSDAA